MVYDFVIKNLVVIVPYQEGVRSIYYLYNLFGRTVECLPVWFANILGHFSDPLNCKY